VGYIRQDKSHWSSARYADSVFFTASDDPADKTRAHMMGAVDFIKKPIKKNELLERVGKIINI
jgi:DNA-binding response OmpR family regulator